VESKVPPHLIPVERAAKRVELHDYWDPSYKDPVFVKIAK
jgi:hypothetical protein